MPAVGKWALNGGEAGPSLWARVDAEAFGTWFRLQRNAITLPLGGVANRPGTRYVCGTRYPSRVSRLVPFVFSQEQVYVLEFGHFYVRFIRGGAQVLDGALAPLELVTPYDEAHLRDLQFSGSADVLRITHELYAPRELARTGPDTFTLTVPTFVPGIAAPTGLAKAQGDTDPPTALATALAWEFAVTAVDKDTGEESAPATIALTVRRDILNRADKLHLTWDANAQAAFFNIYAGRNGVLGFVESVDGNVWKDDNRQPDLTNTPPDAVSPFTAAGDFPRAVSEFDQRLVLAGTLNKPTTVFMSESAVFNSFRRSRPPLDNQAVEFALSSPRLNEILWCEPLGESLIVGTAGAIARVGGPSDGGPLTPSSIQQREQAPDGAARLAPVRLNNRLLYVAREGQHVHELAYSAEQASYQAADLNTWAPHVIDGRRFLSMAYARAPYSVLWAVRDDGTLLGCTLWQPSSTIAWHRHETAGLFDDVCAVPEGDETAVYVVVKRTIDGVAQRFVERFASRQFTDLRDAIFLDCSLGLDARPAAGVTVTVTGAGYLEGDTVTVVSSGPEFLATDVGQYLWLDVAAPEGGTFRNICRVLSYASATEVQVRLGADLPASAQASPLSAWCRAFSVIGGLSHLEGQTVGVLGDGRDLGTFVVSGGQVDLGQDQACVAQIGLPYVSRLETLQLNVGAEGDLVFRRKLVTKVWVYVAETIGCWLGALGDAENLDGALQFVDQRVWENYQAPVLARTGPLAADVAGTYTAAGAVAIEQRAPLPITVLAIAPEADFGG